MPWRKGYCGSYRWGECGWGSVWLSKSWYPTMNSSCSPISTGQRVCVLARGTVLRCLCLHKKSTKLVASPNPFICNPFFFTANESLAPLISDCRSFCLCLCFFLSVFFSLSISLSLPYPSSPRLLPLSVSLFLHVCDSHSFSLHLSLLPITSPLGYGRLDVLIDMVNQSIHPAGVQVERIRFQVTFKGLVMLLLALRLSFGHKYTCWKKILLACFQGLKAFAEE